MLALIKAANLAVRFFLELGALAALAYWGFHTGGGRIARYGFGIGAPVLVAIVWGTFLAPKSSVIVPGPLRLALEVAVFGLAVTALFGAGRPTLAVVLGAIYVVNRGLMFVWGQ